MRTQVIALAAAVALFATTAVAMQTQTVWSGVYSEAQAFRGEKVSDTKCIGCHGLTKQQLRYWRALSDTSLTSCLTDLSVATPE